MQHTERGNYFSLLIKLSTLMTYTEEEIWELEMHFSASFKLLHFKFLFYLGDSTLPPPPPAKGRSYGVCFICSFGLILK